MSLPASVRGLTAARIGLARSGASIATGPLLAFRQAHALARDAVHAALDGPGVLAAVEGVLGAIEGGRAEPGLCVSSQVVDRAAYLMRPDLGRRLLAADAAALAARAGAYDLAVVLGDGLSALAVERHGPAVVGALVPALAGWRLAPPVVVVGARVAVGDAVAQALGAGAVLMLLGERPGLSAPDSLGAYVTWRPGPGTVDAGRNCVSNIRPEGLGYAEAAHRLAFLLGRMRALGLSGTGLKDESGGVLGLV